MRLFARRRLPDAGTGYVGPPAAAMRGRAAEIADAGAVPWDVLWESLKLDAPDPGDNGLAAELGLLDEERFSSASRSASSDSGGSSEWRYAQPR